MTAQNMHTAAPTVGVVPAAADEVSALTATNSRRLRRCCLGVSAQAAAIPAMFVNTLGTALVPTRPPRLPTRSRLAEAVSSCWTSSASRGDQLQRDARRRRTRLVAGRRNGLDDELADVSWIPLRQAPKNSVLSTLAKRTVGGSQLHLDGCGRRAICDVGCGATASRRDRSSRGGHRSGRRAYEKIAFAATVPPPLIIADRSCWPQLARRCTWAEHPRDHGRRGALRRDVGPTTARHVRLCRETATASQVTPSPHRRRPPTRAPVWLGQVSCHRPMPPGPSGGNDGQSMMS